jgi:hypothetical protein
MEMVNLLKLALIRVIMKLSPNSPPLYAYMTPFPLGVEIVKTIVGGCDETAMGSA